MRLHSLVGVLFLGGCVNCLASPELESVYLTHLVHQLEAMKPMIEAARHQQSPNQRVKFHYTAWTDAQGNKHAGLLDDVNAIQQGIQAKLNHPVLTPKILPSISGDYEELRT